MKRWVLFLVACFAASAVEAGVRVKAGSPSSPLAPNIVGGWAYNPANKTSHAIITANIAGVAFGNFPCFLGGVGIDGRGLDSGFSDFSFGMSVPMVTCYAKSAVFQLGYEKPLASSNPQSLLDHTWYFGVGFSFGANPTAKSRIWSGKPKAKSAHMDDGEAQRLIALQDSARVNQ